MPRRAKLCYEEWIIDRVILSAFKGRYQVILEKCLSADGESREDFKFEQTLSRQKLVKMILEKRPKYVRAIIKCPVRIGCWSMEHFNYHLLACREGLEVPQFGDAENLGVGTAHRRFGSNAGRKASVEKVSREQRLMNEITQVLARGNKVKLWNEKNGEGKVIIERYFTRKEIAKYLFYFTPQKISAVGQSGDSWEMKIGNVDFRLLAVNEGAVRLRMGDEI